MSAENFFCGESGAFLFVAEPLFMVLYGVLGADGWCFSVTFYVGVRDVSCWLA